MDPNTLACDSFLEPAAARRTQLRLPDLACPAPLGSPEAFCDAGSCALRYSE